LHSNTYPIFVVEESPGSHIYTFTSDESVNFFVKFSTANYFFKTSFEPLYSIYEISFYPESNLKNKKDEKIKKTIIDLIETFIIKFDSTILYVCDSLDNKHWFRSKLFKKWISDANLNNKYIHSSREMIFDDYELIVGIIGQAWDQNFHSYLNEIDLQNL
jgi:hypothetical protein